MVRWLSGGGAKNLSTGFEPEPWLALERTLGCELAVRFESADGPEPELVTWAWNERIAETVEHGDVAASARRLVARLEAARAGGRMRDSLDVLDAVERERRFSAQGLERDVVRFTYRLGRAEAAARLALTGRRGMLCLDDASEEPCIFVLLPEGPALVRESNLRLADFDSRPVERIELELLDPDGAVRGTRAFDIPICPPHADVETAARALLEREVPFALGRNPGSGLPFFARAIECGRIEVHEYVTHTELIDRERIEGFPPRADDLAAAPTWRDVLACPSCGAALAWSDGALPCGCGAVYPIVDGRPDFLAAEGTPPTPHPENVWSPNPKQKSLLYFLEKYPRGIVLDCGSGNAPFRAPNLCNLEVFPFAAVDVVADGQRLPFRDGSIDAVVSAAVLEHVRNPFAYCAELRRVLKRGGELRIDSAFLQQYHACPDHFFATTRSGLIEAAAGFRPLGVGVASGQTPFVALQTLLHAYHDLLPDDAARERFARMSIGELLGIATGMAPQGLAIPAASAARLAAGVYMHAVKE